MAEHRSFTDYVRTRFDSNFWAAAEEYLKNNIDDLDLNLYRVHKIGEIELSDVKVEYVWVHDLPGMKIQFAGRLFSQSKVPIHYKIEKI